MPLPRWLRPLFPRKPSQTDGSLPPRGEGWGGGPRPANPTEIQPPPTPNPSPRGGGEAPDQSHRIHIAANDPAFAAKREAAVALICQAITDIATPVGYTRKGTTWARTTPHGTSAIHLQRSRYGFTADITLRFLTPDGTSLTHGVWAQDDDICIDRFFVAHDATGAADGQFTYLDIIENPACLDRLMHILATRALPWLDAHAAEPPPNIADFLPN